MNLQLQTIHIKDFRNIVNQKLDLSNLKKIKLVLSQSNGSGKSSLFYALLLCFFPQDKFTTYADYIRFNQTKAEITLISLLDNEKLKIELVISKTGLKRTITYKNQEYINDIAKDFLESLGFNDLLSSVILFSSSSDSLIDMTSTQRLKEMLSLDGSLDKLNNIIDNLKLNNKDLENTLNTHKGQLLEINNQILLATQNIESIEKDTTNINIKTDYSNFLNNFDSSINELNNKYLNLKSQLDSKNLKETLSNKQNKLTRFNNLLNTTKQDKDNKLNSYKAKYINLDNNIKDFAKILQEKYSLNTNNEIKEYDLTEYQNKRQEIQNSILLQKSNLNNYNSKLTIQEKGFCDVCGSKIDASVVISTKKEIEKIQAIITQLNLDLDNIQNQITNITEINNTISNYYKSINDLEQLKKEVLLIKEQYKPKIEFYTQEIEKTNKEIETIQQELNRVDEDRVNKIKQDLENITKEIKDLQNLKITILSYIQSLETLNKNKETKKQVETKIQELLNSIDINTKSLSILSKDFQNYIVSFIVSKFSNAFNVFIKKMFPYLSISFKIVKNGLELIFSLSDIDSKTKNQLISSKALSGAQKSIINIIYVVLKAIILKSPFILLDEVDEKMTDDNSFKVVDMLSQDIFNISIFCISQHSRIFEEKNSINNISLIKVDNGEYTITI